MSRSCKKNRTLNEVIHKDKPRFGHFRKSDANKVFVYRPKRLRCCKFEALDEVGRLLGYSKGNAYRMWMLDRNTIKEKKDGSIDVELIKTTEDGVKKIDFDIQGGGALLEADCIDSSEPLKNTVDIDVQPDPDGGSIMQSSLKRERVRRMRYHWQILIWTLLVSSWHLPQ